MIGVETDVSEEWDSRTDWVSLARSAVRAAVAHSRHPSLSGSEVSVSFASDEAVRALNARWRGKDRATNVLSFPMAETEEELAGAQLLGDVVLARGVCEREAADKGIAVRDHAAHLVVHGTLHLLGYDHELGDAEAETMEAAERAALASLGIADPYVSEAQAG